MKIFNRLLVALALLAAVISGCENPVMEETISVRLNKELISALNIGQTQRLEVTVTPADADVTLLWASDNEAVAVVDEDGNVTGVAEGEAFVSVTADKAVAKCRVKVVASKPEGIRLDAENLDMEVGQTRKLEVALTPEGSQAADMVWTSGNKSIASVEEGLTASAFFEINKIFTSELY